MNFINILEKLNRLRNRINGACQVYFAPVSDHILEIRVTWREGFVLIKQLDAYELAASHVSEDYILNVVVMQANLEYQEKMRERLHLPPESDLFTAANKRSIT